MEKPETKVFANRERSKNIFYHATSSKRLAPDIHTFRKSCIFFSHSVHLIANIGFKQQIFEFLEKVEYREKAFDVVYLDFTNAFDKVLLERLVKKLASPWSRGQVLTWVES